MMEWAVLKSSSKEAKLIEQQDHHNISLYPHRKSRDFICIRTIMTKQANSRHYFSSLSISIPIKANSKSDSIDSRKEKKKKKRKQDAKEINSNPSPLQSICKQSLIAAQMKRTPLAFSTDRTQALTRNKNQIHPDRWNPTSRGLSSGLPSGSTYCLDCGTIREQLGHTADLCQAACQ